MSKKFNAFASGLCLSSAAYNFIDSDIAWGIGLLVLSIINGALALGQND